jgi:myosin heavy subunit
LEMDKKAKEAEEKLLAEEDAKQSEKLEQENKKKEKQRKKREKNKLKKKQALVSDDVQKEEELKDSEQIDESVTKDTIADSQNKSETKQGEPQTKIKVNEEIKPEAIKIKEETNEELYQRFFDSVTGDASLTKIGTIQKKINERNDRKGFDEFLARTIQNNTISNTLIDTIETDSRFRNDTGNVSSRSKKIEFFIDPTLKKIINSGAELQQQKTSDSVTNSSQSSPETTVDTKLESKSLDTTTPPSKEASVDEVGVEAKTTLIPANKAIKELSKYNRQLTREKVNLVQRLVQKDETIRYQQDEITRLSQQLYGFSQENQNLRTQNHNLFVQTQSQAVQINELLENNRSLHMAVNETQRTFQERYASKGTFDPNQFVQQRNEMNLANQAINSGENYRGNYFAAIDGELVNLSISQEAKGKGAQK